MIFLKKKKYMKIWHILQIFWKDDISKNYRTGIWSFFYHQEKWHFFFSKIWSFFYGRKIKDNLSQKIQGNMMLSVCLVKVVHFFPTNMKLHFCQKIIDDLFPKNTLKDNISSITKKDVFHPRKSDISILDWHSRKSSNDSLYFYGDLFKCFHILPSNEKNPRKRNI